MPQVAVAELGLARILIAAIAFVHFSTVIYVNTLLQFVCLVRGIIGVFAFDSSGHVDLKRMGG